MGIEILDKNFLKNNSTLKGKDVYSVLDEKFSLYGVSYDNENKCFVRAPYNIAKEAAAMIREAIAKYC